MRRSCALAGGGSLRTDRMLYKQPRYVLPRTGFDRELGRIRCLQKALGDAGLWFMGVLASSLLLYHVLFLVSGSRSAHLKGGKRWLLWVSAAACPRARRLPPGPAVPAVDPSSTCKWRCGFL